MGSNNHLRRTTGLVFFPFSQIVVSLSLQDNSVIAGCTFHTLQSKALGLGVVNQLQLPICSRHSTAWSTQNEHITTREPEPLTLCLSTAIYVVPNSAACTCAPGPV